MKTRIYTPESAIRRPVLLLKEMLGDVRKSKELAWRLTVRDIAAQYRQTLLGMLWVIILPLANTLTWLFLRNAGIVGIGETPVPYPVYVFTGTMIWAIFMDGLNAPLQKTIVNKPILAKINFPREALILSSIYQATFDALIKIVLMIIGMLVLGFNFVSWYLFLFPLGILSLVLLGTAIGLLLTPIGMLYGDIGKGLPLIMQFFIYLTPVVYPMPENGWVATLIKYNPVTSLVVSTRDWLTGFPTDFFSAFVWVSLAGLALFLIVIVIYRLALPILIERISA